MVDVGNFPNNDSTVYYVDNPYHHIDTALHVKDKTLLR